MGTVGGLQSFGLLGIFVGPVIVAVGKAIFDEWLTHSRPVAADTEAAIAETGKSFPAAWVRERIDLPLRDDGGPYGSRERCGCSDESFTKALPDHHHSLGDLPLP